MCRKRALARRDTRMIDSIPRRGAPRSASCRVAAASDADLTVRVANLPPSTDPAYLDVGVRNLLKQGRVGGLVRVSVPLDTPKERDTPHVATRAFLRFDCIDRAMRAEAALSQLSLDGAKLVANHLGKRREPQPTQPSTPKVKPEYYEHAFPELPEPTTTAAADGRCVELLEKLAARPSSTASEDGCESLLSVASTTPALSVCSYCKVAGHSARRRGVVCCPVLKLKLDRDAQVEVAKQAAEASERAAQAAHRAMERKLERKLRQHEAELTGWTTVGKTPALEAAATATATAVVVAPLSSVEEEHAVIGEATKTADLSRAQKRMQKRREKSRAKRAEGCAQ